MHVGSKSIPSAKSDALTLRWPDVSSPWMARAWPRHGQCQGSTTATRRTSSGLDTRPLGSRPSVSAIREWQHETNLRTP